MFFSKLVIFKNTGKQQGTILQLRMLPKNLDSYNVVENESFKSLYNSHEVSLHSVIERFVCSEFRYQKIVKAWNSWED